MRIKLTIDQSQSFMPAMPFFLKAGVALMATFLLLLSGVLAGDTNPKPIALRAERLPFTPKEFYIAGILDEREETSAVAWLLPPGKGVSTNTLLPVDLQGGVKASLQEFVKKSLPANTALRPVIIRLKECRIMEAPGEEGIAEGSLVLSMSFELQGAEERTHLVDYNGGLKYRRSAAQQGLVEPALRRALASSLEYLNNWMDREAPHNVKLARGVKVFFKDYTLNAEDDTVFYAPDRPLQWEDFQAKPRSHKYAASVYPSFAYKGDSEIIDGYVHLYLNMKVFMLKSSSWVKDEVRNSYGLNHEQRHFDIVKLVVERFKKKIQSLELSPNDYDGVIGYEYIEAYREMNRMQEAYDTETSHGINTAAQERWNRRIAEELNGFAE